MKKKLLNILKILIFVSIGVFLFWLVYRKQDIGEIKEALLQADLKWVILSLFFGLLSHLSRAIRWKILIKPLGYNPKIKNLFFSVMVMYLVNHAIPRSGEIVRCGIVDRYEKIPFNKLLGTVIAERVVDVIVLAILTFIVLITQYSVIVDFVNNNPQIIGNISKLFNSIPLIIGILFLGIAILVVLFVFRKKIRKTNFYKKIEETLKGFVTGFKTVISLKENKIAFILHTIFIWAMYFIMIYTVFMCFEETRSLSIMTGLTIFVITAYGIVVPSPGGIGTWHFIAIETLFIYGVPKDPTGNTFAIVAHESQMIMLVVVGLISLILLPILNNKIQKK